jgi:two-component system sensor histidine kinase and response regulator WspE
LGKVQDISAGALLDDGSVVLIVDVEDMLRSVDKLLNTGRLERIARHSNQAAEAARKRILVVDDSLTVRELQRKLLLNRGYDVAVAVDGMDGGFRPADHRHRYAAHGRYRTGVVVASR